MSVKMRGGKWHYRFYASGKIYSGVCEECTTKRGAVAFEKDEREDVSDGLKYGKRVKKARKIAERVNTSILGDYVANKIAIAEAFDLAHAKPKRKKPGKKYLAVKKSYWKDFVLFMKSEFPTVKYLSDVEKSLHADKYIEHIRTHGRYNKEVKNGGATESYKLKCNLSSASTNMVLKILREVFKYLKDDAGLDKNPFDGIPLADNESVSRDVFTEKEIRTIFEKADEFLYPLFMIGLATAMREGDICLLKWSDVDFDNKLICKKTQKTGNKIEIPMLTWLYDYMLTLKGKSKGSKYVLPDQADVYKKGGISGRVKTFLTSLGIETTMKVEGRDRLISVKDFHSLRHTFCYIAGLQKMPLLTVQSILGHMTPEMTNLYQKHANMEDKRKALEQMPDFMRGGVVPVLTIEKERIKQLLETATKKQLAKISKILELRKCK